MSLGAVPAIDGILLKNITDLIEDNAQISNLPSLMIKWAFIYAIWAMVVNLGYRIYDYIYLQTLTLVKGNVLNILYEEIQYNNLKFFQDNLAGNITNRMTEISRSIEMVFAIFNEKILNKTALIFFSFITIYFVHNILGFLFLIWVISFIGISALFSKRVKTYSNLYARKKALVAGRIVDIITNIFSVRIFNTHKSERLYLSESVDEMIESDKVMQRFMLKLRSCLGIFCAIMIFCIVYYIGVFRSNMSIGVGDSILILTVCMTVIDHMWDLSQEVGDLFEEIGAFDQINSLIDTTSYLQNLDKKDSERKEKQNILNLSEGEIKFENVGFRYHKNINQDLFKNKNVLIPGKSKVALVGFSGAGKTTFINLITRLHEIESGNITIDGQNIKNVSLDSLRQQITVIPQEPILFHRSIKDNILYGKKNASMEEIIKAAQLAHIHDFIISLPNGYDSLCGERGNNLSGGQKQRIVIARAILKDAPILILDEATSNLDSNTENLIQDSFDYLMKDKTVIIIAHRFSTILNADKILVFDKGQIVGEGKHNELLKTCDLYRNLWSSQTRNFISS